MSEMHVVNHLFTLTIAAENAAEMMYLIFAERFGAHPEVAQFWREMAHEEVIHARALERIRSRMGTAALDSPAAPEVLTQAREAARMDVAAAARSVGDLEAAYQLAHELEHSEINAVFEFLVTTFPENPAASIFLREQLQVHARKLTMAFPQPFDHAAVRRAILPANRL